MMTGSPDSFLLENKPFPGYFSIERKEVDSRTLHLLPEFLLIGRKTEILVMCTTVNNSMQRLSDEVLVIDRATQAIYTRSKSMVLVVVYYYKLLFLTFLAFLRDESWRR